jgi:GNAT superfamily N-acetyltransferase
MNTNFQYKFTKEIDVQPLEELFLSVEWDSAKFSEKLRQAIADSHTVVTAWDVDKLVGLVNALSDGIMTAYIHYMLVHPDYQKLGIGRELMNRILAQYADYYRKVLISYDHSVDFYEKCGFEVNRDCKAMYITKE